MNKQARFTAHGFKLALMATAIAATGNTMAANNATATANSTVVAPIAVSKAVDLSFGAIAGGASAGTVTLTPGGTRTVGGGTVAAGGTPAAAQFDVTGAGNLTYAIDMTGTASTLISGSDSMAFAPISDTSASAKTSGTVTTGTLSNGAQSIYVGGILSVGANQNAGTYSGNIVVAVNYN